MVHNNRWGAENGVGHTFPTPSLLMHRVAVAAGAVQGAKCTLGGMTASVDVRPQAGGMALRGVEVAWIVRMVAGQGQGQA